MKRSIEFVMDTVDSPHAARVVIDDATRTPLIAIEVAKTDAMGEISWKPIHPHNGWWDRYVVCALNAALTKMEP